MGQLQLKKINPEGVRVPENHLDLSDETLALLRNVNPLAESNNHGIEIYENVLSLLLPTSQ